MEVPDLSDLLISDKPLKQVKQQFRLYGRGEHLDDYNRLKVSYYIPDSKLTGRNQGVKDKLERLAARLSGDCPLRRDGYMIKINKAQLFLPTLDNDPNNLLGKDLTMIASVKPYRFEKNGIIREGWTLTTTRIESY